METKPKISTIIGSLLFVAGAQFLILLTIAETQYPGYNVSTNVISDLGVWTHTSAYIFNPSIFILGVLTLISGYFVISKLHWRPQGILMLIAGAGGMGVGIFNETIRAAHLTSAGLAFAGTAILAIIFIQRIKGMFGYFSVFLGVMGFVALVLTVSHVYLGLGEGGMERMIAYPEIAFTLGLAGYFLAGSSKTEGSK